MDSVERVSQTRRSLSITLSAGVIAAASVVLVLIFTQLRDPLELRFIRFNQFLVLGLAFWWLLTGLISRSFHVSWPYIGAFRAVVMLGIVAVVTTLIGYLRGTTVSQTAIPALRDLLIGILFFLSMIGSRYLMRYRSRLWSLFLNISTGLTVLGLFLSLVGWKGLNEVLFFSVHAGRRFVGGFTGPNEYGAFVALVGSAVLARGVFSRRGRSRLFDLLKAGLLGIALIYSGSRGAILGGLVGVTVTLGYLLFVQRRFLMMAILCLLFVTGGLLVTKSDAYHYLYSRFQSEITADNIRIEFLTSGIQMFGNSPVVGYGVGGFAANSAQYMNIESRAAPHNDFMDFLVAGGITLLAILLFIFGLVLLVAMKRAKHHPAEVAVLVAVIVFITQELFFNYLTRPKLAVVFWFLVWIVLTPILKEPVSSRVTRRGE